MVSLPRTKNKKQKRLGRGIGSGKGGHTSSRGQKGQKARGKVGVLFEGVKVRKSLLHRLPFLRGKEKFKSRKTSPIIVNLKFLEILPDGSEVNLETLAKNGLVKEADGQKYGVKILGDGKLTKKLKINLPISKSAATKIIKLGGKIL